MTRNNNPLNNLQVLLFPKGLLAFVCFLFFIGFQGFAQLSPRVTATLDTASIKIGEQIQFKLKVEADTTAQVIFPEGQTFSPVEMVEALKTDTLEKKDRIVLQKIYALTQFDSGAYTIPRQKILINEKTFLTDSLKIEVTTVPVDTLKQKMYGIKSLMEVEKSNAAVWKNILWILLGLLILAALLYWFVIRKKPLTEKEKEALLPPYDRAMLELKRLENSKYLIQDEYKKYYSELTDIVRSYIEEDVNVSALESTTDQLIDKLEMLRDAGDLKLDNDTIQQFKRILQTADLVKFAKKKPETSIAEEDRKAVEHIVVKTHEALPEPTEEELLENEEYLEELARKKQKKKVITAVIIGVAVVLITTISAIGYYGFGYVKDSIIGHPTKELLETEWVSSSYAFPPISIETPKVLLRKEVNLPPEAKASVKDMQVFVYNSPIGLFTITTSSTLFRQETEPDINQSVEFFIKTLEKQGAKNITTKQEDFTTTTGVKGIKVYGSGKFPIPNTKQIVDGNYTLLFFGGKGFFQQVTVNWLKDDIYADAIVERIINSVDVKTEL